MREILFRGKRVGSGEWVVGTLVKMGPVGYVRHFILPDYASAFYDIEVDPATVGQYTGLTDKNDVRIFEGDIILISDSTKPVLVEFINFSWECTNKKIGPYYRHRLEYNSKKYEVIGNIHDNPELLKEKS